MAASRADGMQSLNGDIFLMPPVQDYLTLTEQRAHTEIKSVWAILYIGLFFQPPSKF